MKEFAIKTTKERANWGAGRERMTYYRDVRVEDDGTVRAWDHIGEIYSIHHDLTDAEVAEARRRAGVSS